MSVSPNKGMNLTRHGIGSLAGYPQCSADNLRASVSRLRSEVFRLVARETLAVARPEDFVAWGVRALSDGLDTPALRALAGADLEGAIRLTDVAELFRQGLHEAGLPIPSAGQAVRQYVRDLAEEIVAGKVDPQDQVERIHREVLRPLAHPGDLMIWCHLSDGLRPRTLARDLKSVIFDEVEGEALDDAIRQVAEWYLREAPAAER